MTAPPSRHSLATLIPGSSSPLSTRPKVIRTSPDVPKVLHTRHAGVWSDKALEPGALRQMLDASITALTDLNDARPAWATPFRPHE